MVDIQGYTVEHITITAYINTHRTIHVVHCSTLLDTLYTRLTIIIQCTYDVY